MSYFVAILIWIVMSHFSSWQYSILGITHQQTSTKKNCRSPHSSSVPVVLSPPVTNGESMEISKYWIMGSWKNLSINGRVRHNGRDANFLWDVCISWVSNQKHNFDIGQKPYWISLFFFALNYKRWIDQSFVNSFY